MLSELAKKNTLELLNDTLTIREFIISSYENGRFSLEKI